MHHPSVLDFDDSKQTQVELKLLGVLSYNSLDLFEDIIKNQLCGLPLHICKLSDCGGVELDRGEGQVDLVLHLHALLHQKLLQKAHDRLTRVVLGDEFGGKLD